MRMEGWVRIGDFPRALFRLSGGYSAALRATAWMKVR